MILITGATGRVGGSASEALDKARIPFRVLVRDASRFPLADQAGVDVCVGDLAKREDVDRALTGISRALLVTGNSELQADTERLFAERATAAGVQHIVKVSSMEAAPDATAAFPKIHYESEQFIKSLDVAWTMLQPNFFFQNLLMQAQSVSKADRFSLPMGSARTGMLDARDVGAAAATILQGTGHENSTYKLTGDELLSFADVARVFSNVLGREIRYVDQPAEDFRQLMLKVIPSAWHANAVCDLFVEIKNGSLEALSPDLANILGRKPASLADFVREHAGAFK